MGKVAKRGSSDVPVTIKKRETFLAVLKKTGLIEETCKKLRIKPHLPYEWAKQDEDFAERLEEARKIGHEVRADLSERELVRRGRDGIKVKRWYQGRVVGEDIQKSDICLLADLKSLRPERYRDQHPVVSQVGDVRLQINVFTGHASRQLSEDPPTEEPQPIDLPKRAAIAPLT